MKKKFYLFIVVSIVVLLCVYSSLADGEITFNNVPWLSNEETTLKVLYDNGLIREGFSVPVFSGESGYYIIKENNLGYCPTKNDAYKEVNQSISLAGKTKSKIGGSSVKDVLLTFANDRIDSKLICVKVVLDGESFEGISNKLKTVYGIGVDTKIEDEFETVIWTGENNSAVILFTENGGFTYDLVYGRLDSEQILKDAKDAIAVLADPDDASGL